MTGFSQDKHESLGDVSHKPQWWVDYTEPSLQKIIHHPNLS